MLAENLYYAEFTTSTVMIHVIVETASGAELDYAVYFDQDTSTLVVDHCMLLCTTYSCWLPCYFFDGSVQMAKITS